MGRCIPSLKVPQFQPVCTEYVSPLYLLRLESLIDNASALFSQAECDNNFSLEERLRWDDSEDLDAIPPSILKKYISYARKYVHPR
jgi:hypothetical protein